MKFLTALLKHLGIGMALIVIASAILLFTDPRRHHDTVDSPQVPRPKVAILNYTSIPVLEEGEAGLIAGLAESGFVDGRDIDIVRYNAEGDRPTAIMIAKELVGRDFGLITTISTPSLQAVASSNLVTKRPHVFTLVSDPWGAGVGLSQDGKFPQPEYMTGYGTLQPVKELFRMARTACPQLKRVGVAWNPAESNSEANTLMARAICKELGIELVEVTIDSSPAVLDAARALVSRNVDAIWAGGDTTVSMGLDGLVATAREAHIPVFTNMPGDVKKGVLFSLGADYYEVGRSGGQLAARVLKGERPGEIPVNNYVPEQLAINEVALKGLQGWTMGPDWKERAKILVDAAGVHEQKREAIKLAAPKPAPGKIYQVAIAYFAPNAASESAIAGLQRRLAEMGFVEGKNIHYRLEHAQGDMALIPPLMQKLDQSDIDLIVSLTTPCLTSASTMVKQKPVVFTEVYDPLAAGAGTSAEQHVPHVTGVGSFPPIDKMFETMQRILPRLKTIGVVYNSGEANSRKAIEIARQKAAKKGLKLEEATVTNSGEILQAAQVLTQRGVDVLWELGDNTVTQGLEALIKAGLDSNIPVVNSDAEAAGRGALVGVGIRFFESGYAAGELAARVLTGERPDKIPFGEVAQVQLAANLQTAKKLGFQFDTDFLRECSMYHGVQARLGRPLRVAFVELVEGPSLEAAAKGISQGLKDAGLESGRDITIQKYGAQGDLSQLPQIFQTVAGSSADLIITSTTPAMIAAAQSTKTTPIVFTVASNPLDVGLGSSGQSQPNLIGVYDNPPLAELLTLAERREGTFKTVGTIWNPAEPNSEISVKRLRAVCQKRGIKLVERHAAAVNELRDVTAAICQTGIDILVISADNVTSAGFPAILAITQTQKIPIYCTEPDLVKKGADAAIGVNYSDWGKQSARLAAQILAGVPIESLDSEDVQSVHSLTKEQVAADNPAASQ